MKVAITAESDPTSTLWEPLAGVKLFERGFGNC
jgi:hypothetical protein